MLNQVIAWGASFIIGIGVVWRVVSKYGIKVRRAIEITDEVLDIVTSILNAADDKKFTKEEIELILKEVQDLQEVLKK